MNSTKPPGGTRDFLPDEIRRREYVVGVVRRVYESYGFEPLETPAFENVETLLGKYGDEGNKLIFKILRRGEHEASGEADLALRYDLTVPLARVIAQYQNDLPRFFKRYQIQPVWRADRPARGRFREFYQCDVDAVGSTSILTEVEILSAVSDVLRRLGFDDFKVRLNHRALLNALLDAAGIPDSLHAEALVEIDKLDKVAKEAVAEALTRRGISAQAANTVLEMATAPSHRMLQDAIASRHHERGEAALELVSQVIELSADTPASGRVVLDPSLARGLSYYTGAIMEIAVPDLPGSLGGGGRYDNLVGMFLGREVPACGFSLGLERIIVVMTERNMFPSELVHRTVDVMVTCMADGLRSDALRFAAELRQGGLKVDLFPEPSRKLEKALKAAARRNAPFVAVLGDDEVLRAEVNVRDRATGQTTSVARAAAVAWIRERLELQNRPMSDRHG